MLTTIHVTTTRPEGFELLTLDKILLGPKQFSTETCQLSL